MTSSLLETFFGALEGTISVLLTLSAGYIAGQRGLLDRKTVRQISKLCTMLFLPCLIVVQMGPELTANQLSRVWIVPLWGLISTMIAHLIGWIGMRLFKFKYWTIVACGRPNANALPLLLLQSLEHTGVLDSLAPPGESLSRTLQRAKSFILLNAIVQQTITFQLSPSILALDDGVHKDDAESANRLRPGPGRLTPVVQDQEHVGLLGDHDGLEHEEHENDDGGFNHALGPIADTPDLHWPHSLASLEWLLKLIWSYVSIPLLGAILALIIGITPPLHHLFYDQDSALYSSVTQSVENLGDLFVVLQTFTVGAELALVPSSNPGTWPCVFVLLVRFIAMPALSLGFVAITAGRGIYVDDPLVWFLLVLIPAGPSAMLLVSIAELVNVDQGPIAGYLTVSYILSPIMALVCSMGLKVVEVVQKRR